MCSVASDAPLPGLACISASRCLGIMGRHAAPYASAALTRVLSNAGSDLRYEALVALGYLGPEAAPEAAPAVAERATSDEDARLRRQALLTLALFGPDAAQAAGEVREDEDEKMRSIYICLYRDYMSRYTYLSISDIKYNNLYVYAFSWLYM